MIDQKLIDDIHKLCDIYFSCPDAPDGPTLYKLENGYEQLTAVLSAQLLSKTKEF